MLHSCINIKKKFINTKNIIKVIEVIRLLLFIKLYKDFTILNHKYFPIKYYNTMYSI